NDTWYSVTLMSGPGEDPTPAQIDAVRQLRQWLMGKGVAGAVRGHRDFIPTSCPGDRLYRLVKNGTFSKAPNEEDDMPSPKDLWEWDGIPAPRTASTYDKNPTWKPASHLTDINERVRALQQTAAANQAALGELSKAVAELAADRGQAGDADALVARITGQIERVTGRLDVQTGDGESACSHRGSGPWSRTSWASSSGRRPASASTWMRARCPRS